MFAIKLADKGPQKAKECLNWFKRPNEVFIAFTNLPFKFTGKLVNVFTGKTVISL